ncbi:enterocin 1071A family bacteriocin [Enterococcus faecalis]|uniref:enterocin 1071A family bacteriocin n=1 Tax=Enterococcus faecalis TaxID=1351 RepID=UPI00145C2926|nr:enterocin 1071A family bacteriocin [Enterococcus faecalis]NMP56795.1 bacteriocin [Enterococcus faecalis]
MKKYKVLTEKEMKQTVGGGWTDFLEGLLVGFPPKRTAKQLNGSDYARFKARNCGPYGQGGTPNSCN